MNTTMIFVALTSIPSAIGVTYLIFWRYRQFQVDQFRQEMFELRADLFDFADAGHIAFDDRAYGALRSTINGFIRFGHRLTLWHLLSVVVMTNVEELKQTEPFDQRWAKLMKPLDKTVRQQMEEYRARMGRLVIKHLLFAAPEFLIFVLPLFVATFILVVGTRTIAAMTSTVQVSETLWQRLRPRKMEAIDTAAFLYGQPARI